MRRTKTSSRQIDDIEALLERLGSLQITNKALERIYKQLDKEISAALALVTMNNNEQAVISKNIVPDSEWFNRDRTKFKD